MIVSELWPWDWSGHTLDVLTAIGTVGAVVATLILTSFGGVLGRFREWRRRPRLQLSFDAATNINREAVSFDGGQVAHEAAYVRLTVQNEMGRLPAHGVEVLILGVTTLSETTDFTVHQRAYDERHNLGPLPWTHTNPPDLTLGPGASRTVDLGYVVDAQDQHNFTLSMPTAPFSGVQYLAPGSYRLRLAVVANNVDAENYEMQLTYDGLWLSDLSIGDHLHVDAPRKP